MPPGGAVSSVSLSLGALNPCAQSSYAPEDFVAHCGDWGVDLSGYDAASVEVYDSRFDAQSGYAVFRLSGVTSPGCVPSLNGFVCDACWSGDLDFVPLGEVRLYHAQP